MIILGVVSILSLLVYLVFVYLYGGGVWYLYRCGVYE